MSYCKGLIKDKSRTCRKPGSNNGYCYLHMKQNPNYKIETDPYKTCLGTTFQGKPYSNRLLNKKYCIYHELSNTDTDILEDIKKSDEVKECVNADIIVIKLQNKSDNEWKFLKEKIIQEDFEHEYIASDKISALKYRVWKHWIPDKICVKCPLCSYYRPTRINNIIYIDEYTLFHVIAKVQGGSDSVENLRPTCAQCNSKNGTKELPVNMFKY